MTYKIKQWSSVTFLKNQRGTKVDAEKAANDIVEEIKEHFPTSGGGSAKLGSLPDEIIIGPPLTFSPNVKVEEVVTFVLQSFVKKLNDRVKEYQAQDKKE